jgi:hypothetical protein
LSLIRYSFMFPPPRSVARTTTGFFPCWHTQAGDCYC